MLTATKTVCVHDSCSGTAAARGLCSAHYEQLRRQAAKSGTRNQLPMTRRQVIDCEVRHFSGFGWSDARIEERLGLSRGFLAGRRRRQGAA